MKPISSIAVLPGAVGLGTGIVDGIVIQTVTTPKHARTYFRAATFALGFAGDKFFGWHPDISIGLMASSAALFGQQLAGTYKNKSTGSLLPLARPVRAPVPQAAHGYSARAAVARQGHLHDFTAPLDQPTTAAGYATKPANRFIRPTMAG